MNGRGAHLLWFIPIAAAVYLFGAPFLDGQSIFLRFTWDPNNILAFYPWNILSAREFGLGHFPLWNPYNACGAPHLANWQSAPLYPLHLLLFVNPSKTWFDLLYLARLTILAGGVYMTARALKIGVASSILAATAAVFSGYFTAYGAMVHMNVEILFPWAIWLVARQGERWKITDWLRLSLLFALAYLGGNGESAFWLVGLTGMFALWLYLFEGPQLFIGCVAAGMVGLLIASPQVAPFLEYFPQAWHIHPTGAGGQWLDPTGMHSIVFAVGGQLGGHYVPYLGASVLLLAVVGGVLDRKSSYFLVASIVILGLVYGAPVIRLLARLPILSMTASYKYALAPMTVMVALLAGRGLDGLINSEVGGARLRKSAMAIGIFAVAFALGKWIEGREVDVATVGVPLAALATVSAFGSVDPRKYSAVILAVLAAELAVNAGEYNPKPILDPDVMAGKKEIRYLAENDSHGRTAFLPADFPANLNLVAGVSDINQLDAFYPKNYVDSMGRALGFSRDESINWFKTHGYSFPINPKAVDSPVWRELGVRYYMGRGVERAWMKHVAGDLYEDPDAPAMLEADGDPTKWSPGSWNQDLRWRSSSAVDKLRWRTTYLPGWRAWSGDTEIRVGKWGGMFMELSPIPPEHDIRLRYIPWGFRIGLWTGLSTLLFCGCFLFRVFLTYRIGDE